MKTIYLVCINDSTEEAYTNRKDAEIRVKNWKKELGESQTGIYHEQYVHIHEVPLVK